MRGFLVGGYVKTTTGRTWPSLATAMAFGMAGNENTHLLKNPCSRVSLRPRLKVGIPHCISRNRFEKLRVEC